MELKFAIDESHIQVLPSAACGGIPPGFTVTASNVPTAPNFGVLVEALIACNASNRVQNLGHEKYMSPAQWARHFATVKASAGRSCGKTRCIKAMATANDLVIVADRDTIKREYRDCAADVITYEQLGAYMHRQPWKRIFIDEPTRVLDHHEKESYLYHVLARSADQTFIFLGD